MIEKIIDKKLARLGYVKEDESEHGVYYERLESANPAAPAIGFKHIICIVRKKSGRHIMQSYDSYCTKTQIGDYINEVCGVELPALLLLWMKGKCIARRYQWEKVTSNAE